VQAGVAADFQKDKRLKSIAFDDFTERQSPKLALSAKAHSRIRAERRDRPGP
jgi:hypothetical protein